MASAPLDAAPVAYFPKNGSKDGSEDGSAYTPSAQLGPVYDPDCAYNPLPPFDKTWHERVYPGASETGEAVEPPRPARLATPYLVPTLAENERLRLTLLWYHTQDIGQDGQLMATIDALAKGAQRAIGWEHAMAGILAERTYARLATANLPIALLPRRESTCAHTINQAPGSIFMVTDMRSDWRFQKSPHVKMEGLRSYAGTQLRFTTDDGTEVSLGCLCVASTTPQHALSLDQREFLTRYAELISTAITSHTRQRRLERRQQMADLLSMLKADLDMPAADHGAAVVVGIANQVYPHAQVSLQVARDDRIMVEGRAAVPVADFADGVWEDTAYIEHIIRTCCHRELTPDQTVRAIAARCGSGGGSDKYLVVASRDAHHVFDDYDAWFVARCASAVADTVQNQLLKQALDARETFLRGITHQLRTPIHGILGAVEMLGEELASRHLLGGDRAECDNRRVVISTSPSAYIATIKASGQELMTTVNNILKHNTWTTDLRQCRPCPYDLRGLEDDILPGILTILPPEQLAGISVRFHLQLPGNRRVLTTDAQLLRDCLQAMVLNAAQAVFGNPVGTVSVTVCSSSADPTCISFDIVDNGCGIDGASHARIFEAYEKVDGHKPGAGLGLTLTHKTAQSLNGSVRLVSSVPGRGSHFRLELRDPTLGVAPDEPPNPAPAPDELPHTFTDLRTGQAFGHFLDHTVLYLEEKGFCWSEAGDVGLIVTNAGADRISSFVRAAHPHSVVIRYGARNKSEKPLEGCMHVTASGPLHSKKLHQILQRAALTYKDLVGSAAHAGLRQGEEGGLADAAASEPAVEIHTPSTAGAGDFGLLGGGYKDQPPKTARDDASPVRALLVDDNVINLRILEMFCHRRKIPYVAATDGNQAFEEYKKAAERGEPVNLVLTDMQMPNCDGIRATTRIRSYEREWGLSRSRIFIVTGQDSTRDRKGSEEAGADEFLVKPVGPRQLDAHIAGYFGGYDSDR